MKNPNPQGKGLSPILEGLNHTQSRAALLPKKIDQVSDELFTSLFVLNSKFSFKPVIGKTYYLYHFNDCFKLFQTAPNEWACGTPGIYIGACLLHEDITWTINLADGVRDEEWFVDSISSAKKQIDTSLSEAETLEQAMPYYVNSMPFYARLLAYGLSQSLNTSMKLSGINQLSYEQARGLLTHQV